MPNIEPTHGDPDYLGKTATFPESYADVTIPIIQDSMVLPNIERTHDNPDYLEKTTIFPLSNADVAIPFIQDSMVLQISNRHMIWTI